MTFSAGRVLPTQPLVLGVMSDLAFPAAVDHSLAPTALLKLDAALGPVQLVMLTGRVPTPYKAAAKMAAHTLVYS